MRRKPVVRAMVGLSAALAVAAAALGAGNAPPGQEEGFALVSDRVDGVHRDLAAEIAPVRQGGLTVQLSSPSHELEVLSHRILLRPDGVGEHRAWVESLFRGRARIVATIDLMGLPGQLEDEVTVPEQSTRIAFRAGLERTPEGYRVEILEAPSHVEIAIQSRLGEQLVGLCRTLTLLSMSSAGCDGLERALSSLRMPLPPAGKTYDVAAADLTEVERRQLDDYLDRF